MSMYRIEFYAPAAFVAYVEADSETAALDLLDEPGYRPLDAGLLDDPFHMRPQDRTSVEIEVSS